MVDIKVDQKAINETIRMFASTPDQVALARASALRKMRTRIETAVKRQAAKELRMPQRAIGDRFFSEKVKKGDDILKIWIGTHPVSPFKLGSVRPYGVIGKTGGVKAGRRTYRGAFLASIYSGKEKVWIRLRSKHFSRDLYPTLHRAGDRGLGDAGRGRFPVVRAAVPIDAIMEQIVDGNGDTFLDAYEKVFLQELNYYTNVRGKQ